MKKIYAVLLIIIVLSLTACSKKLDVNALKFKIEYESLNGEVTSSGKEHRTISIPEDNPYEEITTKELLKKIENKETFYVYFGDPLCPWCRSVLEKSIEVAKESKVKKIYYIQIWDYNGNEILRSKYSLDKNNKLVLEKEGTEDYYKLLEVFNDLLKDYTLTTKDNKKVEVGEKRIFAPNYIYVKGGEAVKLVTGISDKQTDSRQELTTELLEDEEKIFKDFFNN